MAKDLRTFMKELQAAMPEEFIIVKKEVDPKFEITAIQQKLENEGRFPFLVFENVKNVKGQKSGFQVATNIFAMRQYCAVALGMDKEQWRMETSFKFAERCLQPLKPVIVDRTEAPVKEVVITGDDVDLRDLPVVTHHEMDGYPYLPDAVVAADPDTGKNYNSSHHRMIVIGKNESRIWMSPRHLWNYYMRAQEKGESLPIAHVLGHHPGFYLGSEAISSMDVDEYETIGGVIGEPLRLVPSEMYGDRLMVPADAEVIVEGEILPNQRDAEGPFGEFTGYYGPQRWSPVVKITAVTHRKDPIYLNILVGHADTAILGGIPKEAGIYEEIKRAVPGVKGVHFPISGCCRFHAYISLQQRVDGEGIVAGMASFPHHDELKHVIVVDDDVDPFNEREVMWAMATRVQPDLDINIIKNARGGSLDPSAVKHAVGGKMIVDATRPVARPFSERINIPEEVMDRIDLKDYIA